MYEVGQQNVTVGVNAIQDSNGAAPGEPKLALVFSDIETGGTASYWKVGANAVQDFTLVTLASMVTAHADGGFLLTSDTLMPGLYRLDLPDVIFTTKDIVLVQLVAAGANNCLFIPLLIGVGISVDVTHINGQEVLGNGNIANQWRSGA